MKICSRDEYKNDDKENFCSECGTKLHKIKKYCIECGTEIEGEKNLCPECEYILLNGEETSYHDDESADDDHEDLDEEKVYAFETVDFETLDYNDLSDYTLGELEYIEWCIDSYSDFEYRKSCRISVRNEIARRYLDGDGVDKDEKKAFENFMKSASSGDSHAQFKLGQCYEYGWGIEEKRKQPLSGIKKLQNKDMQKHKMHLVIAIDMVLA